MKAKFEMRRKLLCDITGNRWMISACTCTYLVHRCVFGLGLTHAQHEHVYAQSWCVSRVNLSMKKLHLLSIYI